MKPPSSDRSVPEKLQALRRRIDAVDEKLVRLLNERSTCSVEVGRLKNETGLAIHDPERERQIVDRIRRTSKGPLPGDALVRLFERILDESRRLERVSQHGVESRRNQGEET